MNFFQFKIARPVTGEFVKGRILNIGHGLEVDDIIGV